MAEQTCAELKAWTPSLTEWIVRVAVARLPIEERERFAEEWTSHIADVPGQIGKIAVALGSILAAVRMAAILGKYHFSTALHALDRVLGVITVPGVTVAGFPAILLVLFVLQLPEVLVAEPPLSLFHSSTPKGFSFVGVWQRFATIMADFYRYGYFAALIAIRKRIQQTARE